MGDELTEPIAAAEAVRRLDAIEAPDDATSVQSTGGYHWGMGTCIYVGPIAAEAEIRAKLDSVDSMSVRVITEGAVHVSAVTEWVGVDPPTGDDLYVTLPAPELDGRQASLEWGYVKGGKWSWSPDGASGCFNRVDLMAIRGETV